MNKIIIVGSAIIIAFLIYKVVCSNKLEGFFVLDPDYNVYNQNYNKKWLNFPKGYNATKVQQLYEDGEEFPKSRELNMPWVTQEQLKSVIQTFIPYEVPKYTYKTKLLPPQNNSFDLTTATPDMLPGLGVMENRTEDDDQTNPHGGLVYNIDDNYDISWKNAELFVRKLNEAWNNSSVQKNIAKDSVKTNWALYKHNLMRVSNNQPNIVYTKVEVGMILTYPPKIINDYRYTIFLAVDNTRPKTPKFVSFDMIGFHTTDIDELKPGFLNLPKFSTNVNHEGAELLMNKLFLEKEKHDRGQIQPQPLCFHYNPSGFPEEKTNKPALQNYFNWLSGKDINVQKLLLDYKEPIGCESVKDFYYRPKPAGYWSVPCKKNVECPFNKSNKNYPNSFGKCRPDGYCEIPLGVKPLGYRNYYQKDTDRKALCYNCSSSEWRPYTELGTCCEEQKDRSKYPFLKTPDYAFKNDKTARFNHFFSKNYNSYLRLNDY